MWEAVAICAAYRDAERRLKIGLSQAKGLLYIGAAQVRRRVLDARNGRIANPPQAASLHYTPKQNVQSPVARADCRSACPALAR